MSDTEQNPERRIVLFQRKEIRRTIHNNEWWFVITDVAAALTDSVDPQGYIRDMCRRDPELSKGGQIATPLLIPTAGGPQKLNCANTEGLFRIIQSIPSPKAEPFKRWLARVGYERIQEIDKGRYARPHAGPLLRGEGEHNCVSGKVVRQNCSRRFHVVEFVRLRTARRVRSAHGRRMIHPLLGREGWGEGVRLEFHFPGNARRELEKKSGRKVVTSGNYLSLTQAVKKAKRVRH